MKIRTNFVIIKILKNKIINKMVIKLGIINQKSYMLAIKKYSKIRRNKLIKLLRRQQKYI
jgi:hypothetical protein